MTRVEVSEWETMIEGARITSAEHQTEDSGAVAGHGGYLVLHLDNGMTVYADKPTVYADAVAVQEP